LFRIHALKCNSTVLLSLCCHQVVENYSAEEKELSVSEKLRKEGGSLHGNILTGIQRRVSEKGESRNKRVCCSLSGPVYYPKAERKEG